MTTEWVDHYSSANINHYSSWFEHLQFARDVHDLLGSVLSALLLKCELAHRIVLTQPGQAAAELTEVADITRRAQSDLRAIAARSRQARLDDEISLADAALTAAGVDLVVVGGDAVLPPAVERAFAAILRESTTNLLCHSAASRCEVLIESMAATASICVLNDFSAASRLPARRETLRAFRTSSAPCRGLGLRSLSLRVADLEGALSSVRHPDGGFTVHASVPVAAPAAQPPEGLIPRQAEGPDGPAVPAPWPADVWGTERDRRRWGFASRNLAYIARKGIPVARLCTTAPALAQAELVCLVEAARRVLTDIREVTAAGARAFRLEQESSTVRAVLAMAGIRSTVSIDTDLPEPTHAVMATVLREGVVNVLRHERVTNCEISLRQTDSGIRLDILNDGVYPPGPTGLGAADEAARLRRRLMALGGTLTVRRRADGSLALHALVRGPRSA